MQKVEVKKFLISEQAPIRTRMDLGDLVASAEQLTAEIDGVSLSFGRKKKDFSMAVSRREQATCQGWRGV